MARLATSYKDFTKMHYDLNHEMVNEVYDVMLGDRLSIWNHTTNREELFEVIEKLYLAGILMCLPMGKKDSVAITPKDHTIFKVPKSTKFFGSNCQCGARHTSFPDHHLFYCPLYRRQDR